MSQRARLLAVILLATLIGAGALIVNAAGQPAPVPPAQDSRPSSAPGSLVLLAWNDLGMHCYNADFSDLAVLPPYNTLWAQVIRVGDPPQVVTTGISITYMFTDNTHSSNKVNFWTYAPKLFGVTLPPDIGLAGKGLSGAFDVESDHFIAKGIPLTEYSDSAPTVRQPYQLATVRVVDSSTSAVLAQQLVVAPVSSEMHCDNCHSDDGDATTSYPISKTGKVDTNILALHDYLSQSQYPAGHTGPLMDPARRPILCAECHSSNALGAAGAPGVSSLSNAMHNHHKNLPDITPDTNGCYNCHPGPQTRCLRDVMSQEEGMTCQNCHSGMTALATKPNPWLNEPRCDTCHGANVHQDQALYRFSRGHGGTYCEGCHDSTHAITPSREWRDGLKFMALQGKVGTLDQCTVCHATQPAGGFVHTLTPVRYSTYLPVLSKGAQ